MNLHSASARRMESEGPDNEVTWIQLEYNGNVRKGIESSLVKVLRLKAGDTQIGL